MGVYYKPTDIPFTDIQHWFVADFRLPMTLNLYNYYGSKNIENIFCWAPENEQWWITGFNPEFRTPKVEDMVMLGSIDFTGYKDMFESFIENITSEGKDLKDYIIIDETDNKVWVIWSERSLI